MNKSIGLAVVLYVASVGAVSATPTMHHCRGVDYVYDAGVGKGEPREVDAERTILLDYQNKTAEINSDGGFRTIELVPRLDYLAGYLPADSDEFGEGVRGLAFEYLPQYYLLELKYDLDGGDRYLAFTGICS